MTKLILMIYTKINGILQTVINYFNTRGAAINKKK